MLVLLLRVIKELLDGITRSVFDLRIYLSDISADNPDTQSWIPPRSQIDATIAVHPGTVTPKIRDKGVQYTDDA